VSWAFVRFTSPTAGGYATDFDFAIGKVQKGLVDKPSACAVCLFFAHLTNCFKEDSFKQILSHY